jgi:hypothetical protein
VPLFCQPTNLGPLANPRHYIPSHTLFSSLPSLSVSISPPPLRTSPRSLSKTCLLASPWC